MHGYKTLKNVFKVVFLLFQAFIFISGVALMITIMSVYFRERKLLNINGRVILYSVVISILHLLSSISGFLTIKTKNNYKIAIYICVLIALINLQAITIAKTSQLTENIYTISKNFWDKIDDNQKYLVEESLNCCNFSEKDDRSVCKDRKTCLKTFVQVARGFKNVTVRSIILFIFTESLSIALICILKFKNRNE